MTKKITRSNSLAKSIEEVTNDDAQKINKKIEISSHTKLLSTGSTLLDLACTGGVVRGGGIPGGIIIEIYGPSGAGKTAILSELAASCQINGGDTRFDDPEARLDHKHCLTYGFEIDPEKYNRPDTVREMFDGLWEWEPEPTKKGAINLSCEDSLAALSTKMEMEDADKMGMKRAKDFSEGLRKTCRYIANNNWLIACTNQEREGDGGIVTPGGKGIPYYCSLRMRIFPNYNGRFLTSTKKIGNANITDTYGISSTVKIIKSSIGVAYKEAPIYLIFNHGIDDIRANLEYCKNIRGDKKFLVDGKEYARINPAIDYCEDIEWEDQLREDTIDLWEEVQAAFAKPRKKKRRR